MRPTSSFPFIRIAYIKEQLESYGYECKELGGGVTCTVGQGDEVLLLRADMDALPQKEDSGEPFSCEKEDACHSCGHDTHSAMLLTAAKMLKEKEADLKRTIKFMFQPGEEELAGAKAMIAAGILENPTVNYAMGMHSSNDYETGKVVFNCGNMRAACGFKVKITGNECHGSLPYEGVSALSVAANIVTAVQQVVAYEIQPGDDDVMTFGKLQSGIVENIIPGEAILMGTIRSYNNKNVEFMKSRFEEIVYCISKAFRATAEISYEPDMFALENNVPLVEEFSEYAKSVTDNVLVKQERDYGTEDFAAVSVKVPSIFVNLGMGNQEEGYLYGAHNPKVRFNEEALKVGAAVYARVGYDWATK